MQEWYQRVREATQRDRDYCWEFEVPVRGERNFEWRTIRSNSK